MGVLKPPIDTKGHCSAIHDNTLYLFSPAGFQSIDLKDGAQWKVLPPGISVDGAVCVPAKGGTAAGDALYIVGGRANSTQSQFSGLQKFSYATQQWENISPIVPVTQNRAGHGATFLQQSGFIAMYAGSQDPANTNPSSQSFLINPNPPFTVLSFTSLPPPLTQPMLMPWNESHALAVGGAADNKGLFLFGPAGWSGLGTSLSQPILTSSTQCTIVTADDGSKVLQEYDLGQSPNQVSRYLLYTRGQILPPGSQIGAAKASQRKRRRQLTVDTWPAYNATGAPTATRTSYSIAQGTNGVAVISGGSDTNPIILFNEKQNSWVDPSTVFGQQAQIPISNSAASASRTSSTASASASTTQAASSNGGHSNSLTILGAVLGTVLGIAAIVILIMLCMKRRGKRSMSRQEKREMEDEKANRLSFVDQGTEYMPSTAKSGKSFGDSTMNDSVTSLQIFQGQLPGHRRAQKSDSSTAGLVFNKSPLGQMEPFEMGDLPRYGHESSATQITQVNNGAFNSHDMLPPLPNHDQERSAGWSQYFNNNENLTNLGVGNQAHPQTFLHDGGRSYGLRDSQISASEYADNSSRNTAANMKPLELNLGPKFDSNRESVYSSGVGRAVSTGSGYDTSHYSTWTDDRNSQLSGIMPVPPIGSGPAFGNAFARPPLQTPTGNVATPVPRPSPGFETNDALAYSAETVSSGSRTSDGRPAAAAQDFPMPKAYLPNESPKQPKSPGRGPVIRKMTGSEDMSWLNINAGRY